MEPHAHISATHLIASTAFMVAILGTLHLIAISNDNRWSRAFVSLGF